MKRVFNEGSSNVFKKALAAGEVIVSTLSIITTLFLANIGSKERVCCNCLICSILIPFPSGLINNISGWTLALIFLQLWHFSQASSSLGARQFNTLASVKATVVLPTPSKPVKR